MSQIANDSTTTDTPANICAIVLSWNGAPWLRGCLDALRTQTRAATLVVVDNASADGSITDVRAAYPDVTVIQNRSNLGVAEGYNVGLRHALATGARYVLALNQDTILDAAMIDACVRTADADRTIGAVAPLLLFASDRRIVNSAGIEMNAAFWAHDRAFGQPLDRDRLRREDVLAASGGALFLRGDALRTVGLFDAGYFAYYEDVDLCLRLWANGYRVVFEPEAIVQHHYSTTFAAGSQWKTRLFRSNRWRLALKHFPPGHLLRIGPALLRSELHQMLGSLYHDRAQGAVTVLATYWRIVAALPAIVRYRRAAAVTPAQRQTWWRLLSRSTAMPRVAEARPVARAADPAG